LIHYLLPGRCRLSAENRKADKILIEKVIRALLLLEGLVESGLPFIFKGGTAVMLLQKRPKRFSIDLDIIVPLKDRVNG
jgi:predicted nucleotidyltransferase component of viral defense system